MPCIKFNSSTTPYTCMNLYKKLPVNECVSKYSRVKILNQSYILLKNSLLVFTNQ